NTQLPPLFFGPVVQPFPESYPERPRHSTLESLEKRRLFNPKKGAAHSEITAMRPAVTLAVNVAKQAASVLQHGRVQQQQQQPPPVALSAAASAASAAAPSASQLAARPSHHRHHHTITHSQFATKEKGDSSIPPHVKAYIIEQSPKRRPVYEAEKVLTRNETKYASRDFKSIALEKVKRRQA
ncbi:MAG: hypothetical protein BJ554DRAFT_4026, partial [Olpidium bornovanus]